MQTFLGVHDTKIKGTLSGFDRVRFRGTLRMLANTKGLSCFLSIMGVLLKDFRDWSKELTERIRRATAELAGERQRSGMAGRSVAGCRYFFRETRQLIRGCGRRHACSGVAGRTIAYSLGNRPGRPCARVPSRACVADVRAGTLLLVGG